MAVPQQGVAYTFSITLWSVAEPGRFLLNHTLSAGDIMVQTDGGTFANVTTLPVETPAGSGIYIGVLSAAQMGSGGPATGSKVTIRGRDQTAAIEWTDFFVPLDAPVYTPANSNVMAINSNATAAVILDRSARTIVRGTVAASGSTTTSIVTSSLAPTAISTNQFKDRVVLFADTTTTTGLRGAAGDISASSTGGVLTLASALPAVPASGDDFVIV